VSLPLYASKPAAKKINKVPFSLEGKKCLEQSLRAALALGHNYMGTEHLFFGVQRQAEVDDRPLDDLLGVSVAEINRRLTERGIVTRPDAVTGVVYGQHGAAVSSCNWSRNSQGSRGARLGGCRPEGLACPTEAPDTRRPCDGTDPFGRDDRSRSVEVDPVAGRSEQRRAPG
jgi:hypothetical protein